MNKLQKRRKELNLTQKQVADKLGVAWQVYQRYENASRLPSVKAGIAIAKALQTTVEELWA